MFVEISQNVKEICEPGILPFIVDSIGRFNYQPAISRPDGYRCHHMLWVTKGQGRFEFDGQSVVLCEGQGLFFRAGFPHSYRAAGDTFSSFWITFYGLEQLLEHYKIGNWFRFDISDVLSHSFKSFRMHCLGNSSVFSRSANGYALILEFLEERFAQSAPLCERIDRYLEVHFAEDVSLDDVAQEVGLNKYTLCKQYLKATGTTVMEQLKTVRIAKAKQYLLNTSCSVESVGKMCGFNSPSYFGKVFRELTSKTPFQYRAKKK